MPDNNTEHQLLRLHVLLGDDESQLDEVYQAFQAVDHDRVGSLKTAAYAISLAKNISISWKLTVHNSVLLQQ